jgi:hypothetical protein
MSILNLFPLGLQNNRRQEPAPYLAFRYFARFFGCAKCSQNKLKTHVTIYIDNYTHSDALDLG